MKLSQFHAACLGDFTKAYSYVIPDLIKPGMTKLTHSRRFLGLT